MKGIMGAKKDKGAGERHGITPDYQRFDQKQNMIYAGEWRGDCEGLSEADFIKSRLKKLEKGTSGYKREDWAFLMAATAGTAGSKFSINVGDSGGTSWSPLPRGNYASEMAEKFPKWEGDAAKNTRLLKKIALRYGAGDAGVCLLDRRFVYSRYYDVKTKESYPIRFSDEEGYEGIEKPCTLPDKTRVIPKEMRYVVVLIHPMDLLGVRTAPRLAEMAATNEIYSKISFTSQALAEFIRGLGYNAIPSANDTALNVPLAIDAGLGELTRNAKLGHARYGTCCRISKVITDLPLLPDEPVSFGIGEFCKICKLCAEACPAKAISMDDDTSAAPLGEFSSGHLKQWPMDHKKCREMWIKTGTNCGICIASCPLNRENTPLHRLGKFLIAKFPRLRKPIYRYWARRKGELRLKSEEFWALFLKP